jgi:hypothetical protein
MEVSYVGKREYGGKERWVKYWARLGCWISPCYGPFSLGGRFETYEPFISLISKFLGGPRLTETADTKPADTGAQLYVCSHITTDNMQFLTHFFPFSAPHLFQMQHQLYRRVDSRTAQTTPKFRLCRQLHNYGYLTHESSTEDQISDGHTDDGASRVEPWTQWHLTANESNLHCWQPSPIL